MIRLWKKFFTKPNQENSEPEQASLALDVAVNNEQESSGVQELIQMIRDELYIGELSLAGISESALLFMEDLYEGESLTIEPSAEYIEKLLTALLIDYQHALPSNDNFSRLEQLFMQLRDQEIIALHYAGYTKQDGYYDVGEVYAQRTNEKLNSRGFCFYHRQDIERTLYGNQGLYLAFDSMDQGDPAGVEIGQLIKNKAEKLGFTIEWDGTTNQRLCISNFTWDRVLSPEEINSYRH